MKERVARLAGITAIAALAGLGWHTAALAQQQTTITRFSGSVTVNGTWTRTIIDISEPNGPGGGTIQATYNVVVNVTVGMTDIQLANAYRNACNSTLPGPINNPNGYGTAFHYGNPKHVRLTKQQGTYNYSDAGLPTMNGAPPEYGDHALATLVDGMIIHTTVPTNAEDAPAASPAGLVALAAGLSAMAWWFRRRKAMA